MPYTYIYIYICIHIIVFTAVHAYQFASSQKSLQSLHAVIEAAQDMLWWSFCLLAFVQCVAGMILSTLCHWAQCNANGRVLKNQVVEDG